MVAWLAGCLEADARHARGIYIKDAVAGDLPQFSPPTALQAVMHVTGNHSMNGFA
ncbi:hypothetical protein D3C83_178600 [compost metagenome]